MNYKCLALVGALLFAAPAHALTETAKANPGNQVQVKDSLSIFSLLAVTTASVFQQRPPKCDRLPHSQASQCHVES